jgi:MFS transporter, OFA family, oxalate/formate antiporter
MQGKATNRWVLAAAGVLMQIALGAVYAWSVFRKPLAEEYGASVTSVNLTFTIAIFVLGFAAFAGGIWMGKVGPRVVGMTAGVLYGAGIFLASFADNSLTVLYLTYGVLAGVGLGLGYIVPIATLVKWFPDKRGIITGIAVAGFGAGALITAPLATRLIEANGPFGTFSILGIGYLVVVVAAASVMKNPPEGYKPAGWEPDTTAKKGSSGVDYEFNGAVRTWQWYALWSLLFLNVTAGISILAEAAPMTQELTGANAAQAAGVVGIISIANGAGRFLWAALSDVIGRKWVFLTMFLLQAVLFFLIAQTGSYALFIVLAFGILLCYGGGFGTMPAFAADYFGAKNVGKIYGLMLTAWSFGAVLGPIVISRIRDATGEYTNGLYAIAALMLVSAIVPFIVRPPRQGRAQEAGSDADRGVAPARG